MQPGTLFNPFPGLRPFEPGEDYLFFGREKEIDELLRRLRSNRFLSVVGTSGCGKSSLVRSGLIPSLHSGFMVKAGSSWRVSMLRPGGDPIGDLASSLNALDVLGTDGELASTNRVLLEVTLRRGTLGFVEAVRQAKIPPHDNLLVVVDQFEELFRFRRSRQIENSRDEAVAFVKLLLEATQQDDVPIYVVLTMRSDFIGDCMEYPGLPEAVNAGLYLVPRMTRDELRSAITGPVAVGGGEIAPRLVLRLLNDVGHDPDQLPALQHALMRTWDHWQRRRQPGEPMDIADYEAVGTLRQALSLHAEEAYQETGSERSRQIAERMFRALTDTFSDQRGVRRPTSVQELAAICEAPEPELTQILEVFRRPGRCFLMPPATMLLDSRSIIDLSHESLMRCWTRLITWAEEERVSAGHYVRLSQAASWFEEGTAGLWRDPELELGLQWKRQNQPTPAWAQRYDASFVRAMQFLDRSEKERDRVNAEREKERKRKLKQYQWAACIFGTLFFIALYLGYKAREEHHRADENLRQATNAVYQMLSSAGREQARVWVDEDVPQMEAFRKELLEKAKDFLVKFTKQKPDNDELRYELARGHFRLGDIHRLVHEDKEAVKEYKEAIAQFESLANGNRGKSEYRQALANSYNWLGVTQEPSPDTHSDAEKAYNGALRLQQDLLRDSPDNAEYRQGLARTHHNRAILRYHSGRELERDPRAALQSKQFLSDSDSDFREAISLLEPLAEKKTDLEASLELGRTYNDLGNLLRHEKKLPEAREAFERAVGIHVGLTKTKEDLRNRDYKQELATFYDNLVKLLLVQFDLAKQKNRQAFDLIDLAKQKNSRALDLLEELDSPAPSLGKELAVAHNLRAQILVESQGSLEAEEQECQQSLGFLEKLEKAQGFRDLPELDGLFMDLGYDYSDLAANSLKLGSLAVTQNALENLSRLLPKISEPDRSSLTNSYKELQQKLHDRMAKRK